MVGAGLFVLIDPPAKWSITGPPTSGIHNAVNPSTSNSAATSAIWAGPPYRSCELNPGTVGAGSAKCNPSVAN